MPNILQSQSNTVFLSDKSSVEIDYAWTEHYQVNFKITRTIPPIILHPDVNQGFPRHPLICVSKSALEIILSLNLRREDTQESHRVRIRCRWLFTIYITSLRQAITLFMKVLWLTVTVLAKLLRLRAAVTYIRTTLTDASFTTQNFHS